MYATGFLDLSSVRLVEVAEVDLSVYPDHARYTQNLVKIKQMIVENPRNLHRKSMSARNF